MSSKKLRPAGYVTLEEAQEMNNATPTTQGWVMNTNGEWELHRKDQFANQEQINWLIEQKKFYYAPEVRFVNNEL